MLTKNNITSYAGKRENCLKWLYMTFGYFILFSFLNDPAEYTISLTGRSHLVLFCILCFLLSFSWLINIEYMFRVYNYRNKYLRGLVYLAELSTAVVSLTLFCDVTVFVTAAHWTAGLMCFVINPTAILVMARHFGKKEKNRRFYILFVCGTVSCLAGLAVTLLVMILRGGAQQGKNGYAEIWPMLNTFVMLYLINHTDIFSSRKKRDESESISRPEDSSVLSSVGFVTLILSWIYFTAFSFIQSPLHNTISMIGIRYPAGFNLLCVVLFAALFINFAVMFIRHRYKNVLAWIIMIVGTASITVCAVFPTALDSHINIFHAVSSVTFFMSIMAALWLFLFSKRRVNPRYTKALIILSVAAALTIGALVLLFVIFKQKYGRTGLAELLPLEVVYTILFLENYTDFFRNGSIPEYSK